MHQALRHESGVDVSTLAGWGTAVVTTRAFAAGDVLFRCTGDVTTTRTRYTIQLDATRHLDADAPGRFLNHSCAPSAYLAPDDRGLLTVVAVRDLAPGEQVTVDYATFEDAVEFMADVRCACGAANCRGTVGGWRTLSESDQQRLARWALPHLLAAGSAARGPRPPR